MNPTIAPKSGSLGGHLFAAWNGQLFGPQSKRERMKLWEKNKNRPNPFRKLSRTQKTLRNPSAAVWFYFLTCPALCSFVSAGKTATLNSCPVEL